MKQWLKLALLAVAGCSLVWPVWRIARALPPFGEPTGNYGPEVNRLGPPLRHISNMVSAVNFDFRGIDTLGEEFMLLAAVTGTVLLLRGIRGEDTSAAPDIIAGRALAGRAESTTVICRLLGPLTVLFGLYMAAHATVTPGGGFQGGVVIASGFLLLYLGEDYSAWRELIRSHIVAALEGGGALLFALAGFLPLAEGHAYMENTLPLGDFKDVFSGGLMLVENVGVAFAVAAGFTMLFLEFMEETRSLEGDGDK
ncbi:MAG TPA: MnhB domain-containing protein [Stellaceae bacterium]|nr:MnhB domain-containing protein [Stellaceae bacterium]